MFLRSYVSCATLFAVSPPGASLSAKDCVSGDDSCANTEELSLIQRINVLEQKDKTEPLVYHPSYTVQYPVPGASQTHELAIMPSSIPGLEMLLVSQISSSRLVQMTCDTSGTCMDAISNTIDDMYGGLHGLEPSDRIFGSWGNQVVITLQFAGKIALLNVSGYPSTHKLFVPPELNWEYNIMTHPEAPQSPHRTSVVDNDIWSSCRTSQDIVRLTNVYKLNNGVWRVRPTQKVELVVYPVQVSPMLPRVGPIFLQPVEHEDGKKYVYGSLDGQGYLARVSVDADHSSPSAIKDATKFIYVNGDGTCPIPVGLIKGPDAGSVWFTCGAEGNPKRGTSTFGSLYDNEDLTGNLTIMKTDGPFSKQSAYLHLAWGFGTKDGFPQLALMTSSIFGGLTEDGVTTVTLSKDLKQIRKNEYNAMPRKNSKNHRVLVREKVMYVDGTADGVVTAINQEAKNSFELTFDPRTDFAGHGSLSLYGQGLPSHEVIYDKELTKKLIFR